eukprot:TRINITY_DN7272_c0_g1_i1.p1 TRINITY_DN7272_c0_g1~~TRINITY_DN7272_c0_g1_i1.p1  ORF type:complete len:148 (-),score=6.89 TRINITY_DN7272_c0_g1_i1:71-514(-)
MESIRNLRDILGGVLDPDSSQLVLRSLKTLKLRVDYHNLAATKIAEFLVHHPRIKRVFYPGLECHPDHKIASEQMSGFGGVVSFELEADCQRTSNFVDNLQIPFIAPSLGCAESLVEQPMIMSYWKMDLERRKALGISDSLIRFQLV